MRYISRIFKWLRESAMGKLQLQIEEVWTCIPYKETMESAVFIPAGTAVLRKWQGDSMKQVAFIASLFEMAV